MQRIHVDHETPNLAQLIDSVYDGDDEVILQSGDRAVRLVPLEEAPKQKRRQAGSAKGQFWVSEDFDEPLEDFADYMK